MKYWTFRTSHLPFEYTGTNMLAMPNQNVLVSARKLNMYVCILIKLLKVKNLVTELNKPHSRVLRVVFLERQNCTCCYFGNEDLTWLISLRFSNPIEIYVFLIKKTHQPIFKSSCILTMQAVVSCSHFRTQYSEKNMHNLTKLWSASTDNFF